jgi:tetratricopeptide (TPR) repeat protein
MRSVKAGLIALGMLLASKLAQADAARAGNALEEARVLINVELKFKEAVDLLEKTLGEPSIRRDQRLEAYRLLGIAYVARGATDSAVAAFSALLEIDPTFELDPLLSPKIHQVFDRVKSKAARIPRIVDVRAAPEGTQVVFSGRVADPDAILSSVELYVRSGSEAYDLVQMERVSERLSASVPISRVDGAATRVEYYLLGKNGQGSPIVRVADPSNPSSVVVDRAQPLSPLVLPSEPAAPATPWYGEWWVWAIAVGVVGAGVAAAVVLENNRGAQLPSGTLGPIKLP